MSKIEFFYEDIQPLKLQKKIIRHNIKALINNEIYKLGDVNLIFCSDDYLLDINKEYLNHDYYTDIITFDYVEGKIISGDLFISVDRVKENAKIFDVEFKIELLRVVFHGVLHLAGYGDKSKEEEITMREKEKFYLEKVNFNEIKV